MVVVPLVEHNDWMFLRYEMCTRDTIGLKTDTGRTGKPFVRFCVRLPSVFPIR